MGMIALGTGEMWSQKTGGLSSQWSLKARTTVYIHVYIYEEFVFKTAYIHISNFLK